MGPLQWALFTSVVHQSVVDRKSNDFSFNLCSTYFIRLLLCYFALDIVSQDLFLFSVQLTVCTSEILSVDFPERWPDLFKKLGDYLTSDNHNTWLGSLLVLYQIVKKYE